MIFRFLASDYPILLAVLFTIWLAVRASPSSVRRMWNDPVDWARLASRAAIGAIAGFLIWATVLDNWRQLLGYLAGYLVDPRERWRSDPYLYDPPPDLIRILTFMLLGLAVVGAAWLFARYARGYIAPILAAPTGLLTFFILNSLRTRFELVGPLSERSVDFTNAGEALATLLWFAMFYAVMAILIVSAFALLWGPVAIVVSLLYRSTIGRERYEEQGIYRALRERSSGDGRETT